MSGLIKKLSTYGRDNWERILFGLFGIACLTLCLRSLLKGNVAGGSALFGMGFFSFFYSNLSRFKKFKGLGFEAELWEDKQREAADLIDRLKGIVSAYTREIVMGNVMRGRWGGGGDQWTARWALFDELTGRHTELGQDIDFSQLKRDVDSAFIFDICSPLSNAIYRTIEKSKNEARTLIQTKYGSPITDTSGFNLDIEALNSIISSIDDLFEKSKIGNIALDILNLSDIASEKLMSSFSISVTYDSDVIKILTDMASVIENRPIAITPQLIAWSSRE